MLVEVLKPRTIAGVTYARGEVVDAAEWRNVPNLVRAGIVQYHLPVASGLPAGRKGARHGVGANA